MSVCFVGFSSVVDATVVCAVGEVGDAEDGLDGDADGTAADGGKSTNDSAGFGSLGVDCGGREVADGDDVAVM